MIEATMGEVSLFDFIGGEAAVGRLVEAFYARMDTFPEARTIRAMHADELGTIKTVLRQYLGEWLGGPKRYSAQKGHPRLRRRHLGFAIGEAERDAWVDCMESALEESIEDPEARLKVLADLTHLANWMRNGPGNPHDTEAEHA
jgi:hemoglobin